MTSTVRHASHLNARTRTCWRNGQRLAPLTTVGYASHKRDPERCCSPEIAAGNLCECVQGPRDVNARLNEELRSARRHRRSSTMSSVSAIRSARAACGRLSQPHAPKQPRRRSADPSCTRHLRRRSEVRQVTVTRALPAATSRASARSSRSAAASNTPCAASKRAMRPAE